MKRHMREDYLVVGEGILEFDAKREPRLEAERPSTIAEMRKFRFSRIGPKGEGPKSQEEEELEKKLKALAEERRKRRRLDPKLLEALAKAMTPAGAQPDSNPAIPAGFTYLGQFIDHDLTFDRTAVALGENVSVEELIQGRSPALDLDSIYGRGPGHPGDAQFYADAFRLKMGTTTATTVPDNRDLDGFDLPRSGLGSRKSERRKALIPDPRNDENLAVAQMHLAFIRFHNRVVDHLASKCIPSADLFSTARKLVVMHYQWMIRTDFLPRIVDKAIIDDVFTNGRKFFEVTPPPGSMPTMPIEFSVAAYRLGHSMVRGRYQWNRVFRADRAASLALLFRFSGMSGTLSPPKQGDPPDDPETGDFERLPTNWIADFRRLFDFHEVGRDDLVASPGGGQGELNLAKRIDTLLVNDKSLDELPLATITGNPQTPPIQRNLAFRNLTRAQMVDLATGQQMAQFMQLPALTEDQILTGNNGAKLDELTAEQKKALLANTPLWFYTLREAELNGGRSTGVGGRIVAEVFHRAMEGSQYSILRNPFWVPTLGPDNKTFRMVDLMMFACENSVKLLAPLGD